MKDKNNYAFKDGNNLFYLEYLLKEKDKLKYKDCPKKNDGHR